MIKPTHLLLATVCFALSVLPQAGATAREDSFGGSPPTLVTADLLEAKISGTEGDPELESGVKTKLVALYRTALSNLKQVTANRALAAELEETTRKAPEQVQLVRKRIDSAKDTDPALGPDVGREIPSLQLELRLKTAQADLSAADAQPVLRETAGLDPVLTRVAEQNATLADELSLIASNLDKLDEELAHALMRGAAQEHERVLDDPRPSLSFEGFGNNSITLVLRAFIDDLDFRFATITDLPKAINRKFEQAGIVIAFPHGICTSTRVSRCEFGSKIRSEKRARAAL